MKNKKIIIEEELTEEELHWEEINDDLLWNSLGRAEKELKEIEIKKSEMIRKLPKWKQHKLEMDKDKQEGKKVKKWLYKNINYKINNFDKDLAEIDKKIRSLKWHVNNDKKTEKMLIEKQQQKRGN